MEKKVQSIDRVFDIIELLAVNPKGLGITDMSNKLDLHKSTVHRLIQSLVRRGYIQKNENTSIYKIGLKFIEISSTQINSMELKTEASPILQELSINTNQAVHLAVFRDEDVIYLDKVQPIANLRMYSAIGKIVPLHCSGVGKVLLSNKKRSEQVSLLENKVKEKFTKNTKTDIDEILKELDEVSINKYAVDDNEHEIGIYCISVPVYDYRGDMIAAISTSGNEVVKNPKLLNEFIEMVRKSGQEISERMGYLK